MKIINIEEITNELLLLTLIISLCKLCEFTSVVFLGSQFLIKCKCSHPFTNGCDFFLPFY